jgi:hypothetical protein
MLPLLTFLVPYAIMLVYWIEQEQIMHPGNLAWILDHVIQAQVRKTVNIGVDRDVSSTNAFLRASSTMS